MNRAAKRIALFTAYLALPISIAVLSAVPVAYASEHCDHGPARFPAHSMLPELPLPPFMPGPPPLPGLTDSQDDQLFALYQDAAKHHHALERTAGKTLAQLQQLSAEEHLDEDKARQLADSLGRNMADLMLLDAQLHARMVSLLTKEQRAALQQSRFFGPLPGPDLH
jgi:Spy/CpxP family protein refolding chaperone